MSYDYDEGPSYNTPISPRAPMWLTPEAAAAAREAGADIIVTGTLIEQCDDLDKLKAVVKAAKGI